MQWVWHDGLMLRHDAPLFTAGNRSFKWGDGVFETAKFLQGRLLLAPFHFERLFAGLRLLEIVTHFTPQILTAAISELCAANGCRQLARVRVALYRNEKGAASCVMEATPLPPQTTQWNEQGWSVVTYPHARKSCDRFANLKSANYLPYLMAARYAGAAGADESLVLNSYNRICDGSKTNLFIVRDGEIHTPPLSEGCVAGVMRRYLLQQLPQLNYTITEQPLTEENVQQAEALFVTNAIEGVRWVQQLNGQLYGHGVLKKLYAELVLPLFEKTEG